MHPAIRILNLIAFAAWLPQLGLRDLAFVCALLLAVFLAVGRDQLPGLLLGLLRLRWLWLAIFVLYWGFTPGEPLWNQAPWLTHEGVVEGTRRALLLVALLAAVYLLLALTPTTQLVDGLRLLGRPLRRFGASTDRFALRVALTLEEVRAAQARLRSVRLARPSSLVDAMADAIGEVETRADRSTVEAPVLAADRPPPRWWEWGLPLALVGLALGMPPP